MKIEVEAFTVFSVETRIKIVELLKATPLTVNAMADVLGVTQSAVSNHLDVLKQADLVTDERDGKHIFYSLNKVSLEKYLQKLIRICTCGSEPGKESWMTEPKKDLAQCKNRIENELKQIKKRIAELERVKK
jgi:ArsR family transcriptional regulator